MNKHAIVLADEEWCKVASAGNIKVYDFLKRKRGIYTLKAGSVCVVMTKAKMGNHLEHLVYSQLLKLKK